MQHSDAELIHPGVVRSEFRIYSQPRRPSVERIECDGKKQPYFFCAQGRQAGHVRWLLGLLGCRRALTKANGAVMPASACRVPSVWFSRPERVAPVDVGAEECL